MTPTLKELPGRANLPTTVRTPADFPAARDAAFAKEVLAARCSPATMALVLEALEEAQREIAENHIGRSFENNRAWNAVTKAIEALDGTALNKL